MELDKQLYTEYKVSKIESGTEFERYSLLVRKWIVKLGLQEEPISALFEEEGENIFSFSKVCWNPLKNYWEIHYKYPLKELTIIHELGHLYLYKLDDNLEYYKKQDLALALNKELWMNAGTLEDIFVEKVLGMFPEIRELQVGRARKEFKAFTLMELIYIAPHYKERVNYIREILLKAKKYSQEEINAFLKLKYGKLYK